MAKATPVDSQLAKLLDARVADLQRLLPTALKAKNVDAIHDARVATRRIKAALDLAGPLLSDDPRRRFARALRRLRRTFGPLRDADVMLIHLKERAKGRHAAPVEWLAKRLRAQRAELSRDCCDKASSKRLAGLKAWRAIHHEIRLADPIIRRLAARAVPTQLESFREQADQLARFRDERSSGLGPDVHQLRIAGKLLRYTLELAEPMGYELSASVTKSFKRLQDALGIWHDYVLLGEHALQAAIDDDLALHQPRLYGELLQLAHTFWKRSELELTRFTRIWHDEGNSLAKAILAPFKEQAAPVRRRSLSPPPPPAQEHNGNGTGAATQSSEGA